MGDLPDFILYHVLKHRHRTLWAGLTSRGGFNEISRGSTEWLVKPAPTGGST